jgi:predicted Fe-Mo cluster-binding NifX family protein
VGKENTMQRIAVPLIGEELCRRFGEAEAFVFFDVDETNARIASTLRLVPPPYPHDAYPEWLRDLGVNTVLAGGIGKQANQKLEDAEIDVVGGIAGCRPQVLVQHYLREKLTLHRRRSLGGSKSRMVAPQAAPVRHPRRDPLVQRSRQDRNS